MKVKKSFIATLLIVMLVLPLVFSSMTVEAKRKSKKASKAEVYNQIAIQAIPTQDGLVAVFVTNDSTTIIDDLELTIEYLDESGTTIDLDTDGNNNYVLVKIRVTDCNLYIVNNDSEQGIILI